MIKLRDLLEVTRCKTVLNIYNGIDIELSFYPKEFATSMLSEKLLDRYVRFIEPNGKAIDIWLDDEED